MDIFDTDIHKHIFAKTKGYRKWILLCLGLLV